VAREAHKCCGRPGTCPARLAEGQRDAVLVASAEQEAAGIDIVTDGEQSRQHFVHGFLEAIDGIDFATR
jgi:5-methyltetrahydropteroyltriglutamate--homocysteine methyltransferase